jgi:hypothetical protein
MTSLANMLQAGSIITTRLIMIIATVIISATGEHYTVWSCAKIGSTLPKSSMLLSQYPACASYVNGSDPNAVAPVLANLDGGTAVTAGASLNLSFGMGLWLAVAIHAIGVEVYVRTPHQCFHRHTRLTSMQLHLTPREAERLRKVSYQRQLEAGMRNPGSAGLTADRLGDAEPWTCEEKSRQDSNRAVGRVLPTAVTAELKE